MAELNNFTQEPLELQPDPQRISAGLRDTGYNFNTAVADIVDNSIAANATKMAIEINVSPQGQVKVYFADNGCGMDKDGLINAMKYGSKERPNKKSLGKFGLGLKTASSAFCKQYSLISRANPGDELLKVECPRHRLYAFHGVQQCGRLCRDHTAFRCPRAQHAASPPGHQRYALRIRRKHAGKENGQHPEGRIRL